MPGRNEGKMQRKEALRRARGENVTSAHTVQPSPPPHSCGWTECVCAFQGHTHEGINMQLVGNLEFWFPVLFSSFTAGTLSSVGEGDKDELERKVQDPPVSKALDPGQSQMRVGTLLSMEKGGFALVKDAT